MPTQDESEFALFGRLEQSDCNRAYSKVIASMAIEELKEAKQHFLRAIDLLEQSNAVE